MRAPGDCLARPRNQDLQLRSRVPVEGNGSIPLGGKDREIWRIAARYALETCDSCHTLTSKRGLAASGGAPGQG